jgi:hypothetical protein
MSAESAGIGEAHDKYAARLRRRPFKGRCSDSRAGVRGRIAPPENAAAAGARGRQWLKNTTSAEGSRRSWCLAIETPLPATVPPPRHPAQPREAGAEEEQGGRGFGNPDRCVTDDDATGRNLAIVADFAMYERSPAGSTGAVRLSESRPPSPILRTQRRPGLP